MNIPLKSNQLDAFLVSHDANIRYLTGFPASESWLLALQKKSFYITDFRYVEEAKKGLPKSVTVKRYEKSVFKTIFELAQDHKIKNLGFDDRHVSLSFFKKLQKECLKGIKLIAKNGLVENLRQVKTPQEISYIRKALQIHAEAYQYLRPFIKPGVSEKELFDKLEAFVKAKGAGFSFNPIIASGPNSALPHAKVTDRRFQRNDLVLIDMGIDYKGYKSDLTRMFFLGKIPQLVRDVNAKVKSAQLQAIKKIRAGVKASDVDHEARNYLAKNHLAKYFGHSLGHGVGLEIHEDPRLSSLNTAALQENMVITVEPAVYIPNKFGIRIEDMVIVTKTGCEVLSGYID